MKIQNFVLDLAQYTPVLPIELPLTYQFARSKIFLVDGTLADVGSRNYPNISMYDSWDRLVFNVKIDPEDSVLYMRSSFMVTMPFNKLF